MRECKNAERTWGKRMRHLYVRVGRRGWWACVNLRDVARMVALQRNGDSLLTDDEVGTEADFLEAGAVPKDAVDYGFTYSVVPSEKDLDAVT